MVSWSSSLYIGESVFSRHERLIRRIGKRKISFGAYCIAYATNRNNLFDIIPANELLFPVYKKADICILGLAGSRDEAMELAADMIMEVYSETGGFQVREYFK